MTLSITVFWKDQNQNPQCRSFSSGLDADPLGGALKFTEAQRQAGFSHVVMSTENSDSVGKPGVKAFDGFQADGVTPYDWMKRRTQ